MTSERQILDDMRDHFGFIVFAVVLIASLSLNVKLCLGVSDNALLGGSAEVSRDAAAGRRR